MAEVDSHQSRKHQKPIRRGAQKCMKKKPLVDGGVQRKDDGHGETIFEDVATQLPETQA